MYFKQIRKIIGTYILKKELLNFSRKKIAISFAEVKTVLILFEASKIEDIQVVKKYVAQLKDKKKKVKIIGYFDTPFPPDFPYSKLEYDFFNVKEVNWYLKPTSLYLDNLLAEEFDVLLDLNTNNFFPITYISSLSKAHFKVGKYSQANQSIYDLMIDTGQDTSVNTLLTQIEVYLNMINS